MPSLSTRSVLLCAGLGFALGANAQEAPSQSSSSQIVVIGRQNTDRDIHDFVGALAKAPPGGQLARFEERVCPVSVGLSPSQGEALVTRMRRVAGSAGMRVDKADCRPNVVVVVTSDKKAFLNGLLKKHPRYFGALEPGEVSRLFKEPGPAVAWQLAGPPLDANGVPMQSDLSEGVIINRTITPASRLTSQARPQFAGAVVIVENRALVGLTTIQLADYAAMRAYAAADPKRLGGVDAPSILTVLEAPMGSEVPLSLTRWDLGFLRGLYDSNPNQYASAQRGAIASSVARELNKATP